MKRKSFIKLFFLILSAALLSTLALVVGAQEQQVTSAFLKADDARPTGPCPITVTFSGYIKTAGPGTVKYTFTRSDGAMGPVHVLEFKEAGMQSVSTTWTIGDAKALPTYEGWQAIKILSPNQFESSQEAGKFSISCVTKDSNPVRPNPTGDGTRPNPTGDGTIPSTKPATGNQSPNERLTLAAPTQLPQNRLEPIKRQRVPLPKPDRIRLIPDKNFAGIFLIKFVEGSHVRYRGDGFTTGKDSINKEEARRLARLNLSLEGVLADLAEVNELVRQYRESHGFVVRRTFKDSRPDPEAQFREKEKLEIEAGEELADLDLYYTIAARDFNNLIAQEKFMNALNRLKSIEFVQASFLTEGAAVKEKSSLIPTLAQSGTPDLTANQTYLDAAPNGIDARYAWTVRGGRGDGIKIIDVEFDWVINHEDFASAANRFWGWRPGCAYDGVDNRTGEGSGGSEHGTAVMGILNAPHNGFGVNGIVPNVRYGLSSICRPFDFVVPFIFSLFSGENITGRSHSIVTATAIDLAAEQLDRGDVLLIEQHTFGPLSGVRCPWGDCSQWEFVPMEFYYESFDVIRRATARRVIVVEAAGNGGQDLSAARYSQRFNPLFRHSGAILVGASNGNGDRNRAGFSNYSNRIDLNGWGGMVTTLGYGGGPMGRIEPWNFGGAINRYYTNNFGGTSSAAPLVAGAVVSIQGARRAADLEFLSASQMRVLLDRTGTPQTIAGTPADNALREQAIGRQPNLRAALMATLDPATVRGDFTGPGTYFIQARHSGKVLDVNIDWFSGQDNGRPVGQFDNNNGDHQKFIIEPVGEGYYRIRAKHSGKCLEVDSTSLTPGAGVQQSHCNGLANQQFAFETVGQFYKFRARHSGLYFDITGLSQNNGARLVQFNSTAGSNQHFQFIKTW